MIGRKWVGPGNRVGRAAQFIVRSTLTYHAPVIPISAGRPSRLLHIQTRRTVPPWVVGFRRVPLNVTRS